MSVIRNFFKPFSVILALTASSLIFSHAAKAQGEVKETHGGWEIRCETPTGAHAEQCALIQFVVADDRPNVGLTVIILKTAAIRIGAFFRSRG